MGKRRKGQGQGSGASELPAWSSWLAGLVLLAAMCALAFRSTKPLEKTPASAEESAKLEAIEREQDQLDMVRNALFSGSGDKPGFEPGKDGFAGADYWEDAYQKSDRQYDWHGTWSEGVKGVPESALRDLIAPSLPGGHEIAVLNLGCGNSRLAEEMYDDGYRNITNVDISHAVIRKMRAHNAQPRPEMSYLQMDISKMSFDSGSFDLVVEKGTLDALYTGATDLIPLAVDEAWRVLRPGGLFVSITFGGPKTRWQLFKPPSFAGWASRSTRVISKSAAEAGEAAVKGKKAATSREGRHHGTIYVYLLRKGLPGEAIPELTPEEQEDRPRRKRQS